jgi:hypothetical protein
MNDLLEIARQWWNSLLNNVLNTQTVDIYFHRSPGNDNGGDRAISGLRWRVMAQGFVIQPVQTTGNDGLIQMDIRGGVSTLQIMHNNNVMAEYEVRVSSAALQPVANLVGQQERLRLLGYHIGHAGPGNNGVGAPPPTAAPVAVMEDIRSILDFQADQGIDHTGTADAATRPALTGDAGA